MWHILKRSLAGLAGRYIPDANHVGITADENDVLYLVKSDGSKIAIMLNGNVDPLLLSKQSTAPTAPIDGLKLFCTSVGGSMLPAIIGKSGLVQAMQPFIGKNRINWYVPQGNSTTVYQQGFNLAFVGTATVKNVATTNLYTYMRGIEYLVTTASATAVSGYYNSLAQWCAGDPNISGQGGYRWVFRFGMSTGTANTNKRSFCGLTSNVAAPTDVNPSTLTNMIGLGFDATDSYYNIMYNDGNGSASKIDLGVNFPKPSVDRAEVMEFELFCAPGATKVSYKVNNLVTGKSTEGEITTDLPAVTTLLSPRLYHSVGGTSSVVGTCIFSVYNDTDN